MSATPTDTRTEAVAHLKFARVGPRKLRRVANAIRGMSVREALVLLKFSGVFASEPLERLLRSAVANAENNHNMDTDGLFVRRITVDGGPGGGVTKRLDPRAQGRANFKRKRMSHVTIAVGEAPARKLVRRSGASIAFRTTAPRAASMAKPKSESRKRKPAKKKTAAAAAGGEG